MRSELSAKTEQVQLQERRLKEMGNEMQAMLIMYSDAGGPDKLMAGQKVISSATGSFVFYGKVIGISIIANQSCSYSYFRITSPDRVKTGCIDSRDHYIHFAPLLVGPPTTTESNFFIVSGLKLPYWFMSMIDFAPVFSIIKTIFRFCVLRFQNVVGHLFLEINIMKIFFIFGEFSLFYLNFE